MRSAVLFLMLLAACRQETSAQDYEQSCNADDDCVTMYSGGWCPHPYCRCDNAAINEADEENYAADASEISCGPDVFPVDCVACPQTEAFCDSGRCDIRDVEP